MMHSSLIRIIGAILVLIALGFFLFGGLFTPTQPPPAVQSTLPGAQTPQPKVP